MKHVLEAQFAPYGDGSDYSVKVEVRREGDDKPTTIIIDGWRWDAAAWPEVKAGVDALLAAIPSPRREG